VGTAHRLPPRGLILSRLPDEAIAGLVDAIFALDPTLDGVLGPCRSADAFAARWSERSGVRARVAVDEGVYQLDAIVEPRAIGGRARVAEPSDASLLRAWFEAFAIDAHLPPLPIDTDALVKRHVDEGTMMLWELDGRPVAMAAHVGNTPNGGRVGAVYTPAELRGNGYASAITAAVSRRILGAGKRFCFLFTDLANPTSNRIYQRLGYRRVGDFRWWSLGAGAAG
jgi:hypothetical protein